jgi:hypothetical protein
LRRIRKKKRKSLRKSLRTKMIRKMKRNYKRKKIRKSLNLKNFLPEESNFVYYFLMCLQWNRNLMWSVVRSYLPQVVRACWRYLNYLPL